MRRRPDWHIENDMQGAVKVVMTGSASDPLYMVIVRDFWLTGLDEPSLHTMYVDNPMRGHGLMQSIALVNSVFKDKPGGLVVDYLGLERDLYR